MKKHILQIAFVLICGQAHAQKDVVLKAFEKYKIDPSILDNKTRDIPDGLSYDLKETVATEGSEKVILAHYDATKPEEERWTILSSNDQEASTAEVRRFKKEHAKPPGPPTKPDDNTFKIEKEDDKVLVVSYMLDPSSLSADASFLKDCRNFITVDIKTGKLLKAESVNEKPLKVKAFNVPRLNTYGEFIWSEDQKQYLPKKTSLDMEIKLLGQSVPTTTMLEYSNYKK